VRPAPWTALLLACTACARGRDAGQQPAARGTDMPVALNGESPFQYPAGLYDEGVEGEVRLRLYVDSLGHVVGDSTRIASSSGTPGLDTAALRGAAGLRFAPGRRDGTPVGMAFYQPVIFRRGQAPEGSPAP
jgi:TonB family protein